MTVDPARQTQRFTRRRGEILDVASNLINVHGTRGMVAELGRRRQRQGQLLRIVVEFELHLFAVDRRPADRHIGGIEDDRAGRLLHRNVDRLGAGESHLLRVRIDRDVIGHRHDIGRQSRRGQRRSGDGGE